MAMFGRLLALVLMVAVSLAFVSGCRGNESAAHEVVRGEEAASMLSQAVEFTRAEDVDALCRMTGSEGYICQRDAVGLAEKSLGEPVVVGSRRFEPTKNSHAATVLELCTTVNGTEIYSEFYVVRESDGGLVAPHPVYWIPRRIHAPGDMEAISMPGTPAGFDPRCG